MVTLLTVQFHQSALGVAVQHSLDWLGKQMFKINVEFYWIAVARRNQSFKTHIGLEWDE